MAVVTLVVPTVEVFFDLSETGGAFFTLDDPVRGVLDDVDYTLGDVVATDITSFVYDIAVNRGRSRELDEIQAGTCAIKLRNYDGRFLPDDLNDHYLTDEFGELLTDEFGNPLVINAPYGVDSIRPGKRVRVSVGGSPIFDGIIDAWDYKFDNNKRVDASFTATDALSSLARKSLDEWTTTPGQTAGERLVDLLDRPEVQYPANRAIDNGTSTLTDDTVAWNTNALQYGQLVAKSELGRLFAAANGVLTFRERLSLVNQSASVVFADDGNGIGFSGVTVDTSSVLLSNRVSVEPVGGTIQIAENSSSIDRYGLRQLSLSGILLDSDAQAADMAGFLSNIYGEPQTRIASLVVYLDGLSATDRAQVLALDLASVVSVAWTPTGASSQTVQLSVVEGVSHQTGVDSLHTVSLSLSPIAQAEVFVLDSDVLGVLDSGVLAY